MLTINSNFLRLKQSFLFTEVTNRTQAYAQAHPNDKVLKLGIGDVQGPLVPIVIEALHNAVEDQATTERFHGYGLENGPLWLRQRITDFDYAPRGIQLSHNEVFISDGIGSDIGNLSDIFDTHNRVAITDPVYPAYIDSNTMAGREIMLLPCTPENSFCPALPDEVPDIIYLCSPNNPTGTAMTRAELKIWVDYAIEHHSVIIFDAAYEPFIVSSDVPHSIYEIEGAKQCAIELCSMSKRAGFTGIRCGYTIVPNELQGRSLTGELIPLNPLWLRRTCTKYNGTSYISERAAEAVLTEVGRQQTQAQINIYHNNAAHILEALKSKGMEVYGGIDSPYIWMRTPDNMGSWQFFDYLLNTCQVVCTPGVGFGEYGTEFVRFSAFGAPEQIAEATERIVNLL